MRWSFGPRPQPRVRVLKRINIADQDGAVVTRTTLLEKFTAVDFGVLTGEDTADSRSLVYLSKEPKGVDRLTVSEFHNFLWLFEKTSSTAGTDDGRRVVVFSLIKVEEDEGASDPKPVTLTYEQTF